MDPVRDPNSWKLVEDCQLLARQARSVLFGVRSADEARAEEAGRLVRRAIELLGEPRTSGAALKIRISDDDATPKLVVSGGPGGPGGDASAPTAANEPKEKPPSTGLRASDDVAPPGPSAAAASEAKLLSQRLAESAEVAVLEARPSLLSAVAASDQHTLVLHGRDKVFTTPDLIGILSSQKKSGVLEIVTTNETFLLEILDGDVVHAQSNHTPDGQRLGDILVQRRVIDRASLEETRQRVAGPRLGTTLVAKGLVTREQLRAALQVQIQNLFQRMFENPMSRFSFWSGPLIHAEDRVRLNATSLLLEGARVTDEKNWFWKMG